MDLRSKPIWTRFAFSLTLVTLTFVIRASTDTLFSHATFLLCIPTITAIAFVAGLAPAFISVIFVAIVFKLAFWQAVGITHIVLFILISIFNATLVDYLRKTKNKYFLAERQLAAILKYSPSIIFSKDANGKYLVMSETAIQSLGYTADMFIGRTDHEVFPRETADVVTRADQRVWETRQAVIEEQLVQGASDQKTFLVAKFPLLDSNGNVHSVGGIATDISALKRIEHEKSLLLAREQEARCITERALEKMNTEIRVREQFIAILSHDLRNPLAAVKSAAELILQLSEHNQRIAANILRAANRMDGMIRDLLDASRIQAGQPLVVQLEEFNAFDVITQTVNEMRSVHGDRIIITGDSMIQGHWNRLGLIRIIENLIKNAIKFGGNDQPILVRLDCLLGLFSLKVHNQGNPIPEDELPLIFDSNRKLFSKRNSKKEGWGLGLTLVKGMTQAHGGTVSVESTLQKGTTFSVTLPLDCRPFQKQFLAC